jgi:ABC-type multidrug transport system fused ATPase/permease subunit
LERVTKSPVINLIAEIINGREVINCFGCTDRVIGEMMDRINDNTSNILLKNTVRSWFNVRLCNYNLVMIQTLVLVYYFATIETMEDTLLIIYSIQYLCDIINNLKIALEMLTNLEIDFVAIERCDSFEQIQTEKNYMNIGKRQKAKQLKETLMIKSPNYLEERFTVNQINDPAFRKSIFTRGNIEFRDVWAKYPDNDDYCLKRISFKLKEGEKLGIVGKTGSGKSTIIKLLTRYVSESAGSVRVDEYDISQFDLKQLRSEMLVISQEIALYEGTILENMYPECIEEEKTRHTDNNMTTATDNNLSLIHI